MVVPHAVNRQTSGARQHKDSSPQRGPPSATAPQRLSACNTPSQPPAGEKSGGETMETADHRPCVVWASPANVGITSDKNLKNTPLKTPAGGAAPAAAHQGAAGGKANSTRHLEAERGAAHRDRTQSSGQRHPRRRSQGPLGHRWRAAPARKALHSAGPSS